MQRVFSQIPREFSLLAQIPLKLIGMAVPSAFLFHYPELRWNHPLHPCFTPPMRFRHVETVSYDRRLEAPGREYNRVLDAYLNGMISDAESEQRLLEPPNASASKQNSHYAEATNGGEPQAGARCSIPARPRNASDCDRRERLRFGGSQGGGPQSRLQGPGVPAEARRTAADQD